MRRPLVAGNWKMHGSRASVDHLLKSLNARAQEVRDTDLLVCPPFVYLEQTQHLLKESSILWGAQTVAAEQEGAYTGEVSCSMLKEMGCTYVIVGHSERRTLYSETSEQIAKKFVSAMESGLRPILCVGESLAQREAGATLTVIEKQLDAVLAFKDNLSQFDEAVVAYEPVWAIGTGKQATPEQVQEVHEAIRARCGERVRVLYGGSVKPDNAAGIFAMPDVDGALVGGASLDADKFIEIALCSN